MLVQLLSVKNIQIQGRMVTCHAGDMVDVGRQTARMWIAENAAREVIKADPDLYPLASCLVAYGGGNIETVEAKFSGRLAVYKQDTPGLHTSRNVLWNTNYSKPRIDVWPVGLGLLDTWQMAVPLIDYTTLARDIGTPEERERTVAIIRDLRVPVYDTRIMFVRRCSDTRAMLDEWASERAAGGDERLAFLRVFYKRKPTLCALPASWLNPLAMVTGRV